MTNTPSISATLVHHRKRRRRRRWLTAAAALVAAAAIALVVVVGRRDKTRSPTYATEPVVRGDVVAVVTATGTLSPVVRVEVGSQVSGRIAELYADYNSRVTAGQVIARIDPARARSTVAQARARLASSRADLERARAVAANATVQHQRLEALKDIGAVAPAEVDAALAARRSADAAVAAAGAAISSASAALSEAEVDLEYTTIRSPIDGVVVSRHVDVGQTVAASLAAPVLFVIAEDLAKMELHTSVAESDVGRLEPGDAVAFTVDAFPARTFTGQVRQVRYEATTVSNVVTYDAVVSVANPDLALRPGMTANVTFAVEKRRDVLVVPQRALAYQPAGAARRPGRATVWVHRHGRAEPTPVEVSIGLSDGYRVEVTSGDLRAGDLVIVGDSDSRNSGPSRESRRHGPPRIL